MYYYIQSSQQPYEVGSTVGPHSMSLTDYVTLSEMTYKETNFYHRPIAINKS